MKLIRIGTRTSNLAMWQANKVKEKLENSGFQTEIVGISSSGDKSLGGDLSSSVGQFIHAVDNELLRIYLVCLCLVCSHDLLLIFIDHIKSILN